MLQTEMVYRHPDWVWPSSKKQSLMHIFQMIFFRVQITGSRKVFENMGVTVDNHP